MATNPFFNRQSWFGETSEEKSLYEQLCIEAIQITGVDVYYCFRNKVKVDDLFGEDVLASFSAYHIVEMYLKNPDEFLGQDKFMDMFGLNRSTEIQLDYVTSRFAEITGQSVPAEGDLLWIPQMQRLFEIRRAFTDSINNYIGSLTCELFTPSHEEITITDAQDIDQLHKSLGIGEQRAEEATQKIQTEANTVLDFSESNPFGDWSQR